MSDIERLRLQLLANGYSPIRNRDKRTFMEDWPRVRITPEEIGSWTRRTRDRATGLRVENGLAVIDIDIDDGDAVAVVANAIFDAVPELATAPHLPVRYGRGAKEAWFLRSEEPFSRMTTRAWLAPGTTVDDGAHRVEVFGGASPRQFGAFGPHTVTDAGEVLVEYQWADPADTPATVPLRALCEVPKASLSRAVDAAEAALAQLGWAPVQNTSAGENEPTRVYDLQDTMTFDLQDGRTVSLDELRRIVADGETTRCSASWLEGPMAVNRSRCLVHLTRSGHVAIWETAAGVTHIEAAGAPRDMSLDIDRIAELQERIRTARRTTIRSGDDAPAAASKLVAGYVFCGTSQTPVYPLYADPTTPGVTVTALRNELMPYRDEDVGPRGGRIIIHPVDLWLSNDKRIAVRRRGVRPDKPSPLFSEDGEQWQNLYHVPQRLTLPGGDAGGGLRLLEHLLPDADERAWFGQWLAHKFRNPHVPGPAVVMVAHGTYGTGRGTLAKLIGRLLGESYVQQQSFENVAGRTSQSQYTDWQADALVTFIAEARDTSAMAVEAWSTKHNAYERLKEIVEVSPTRRTLIAKGRPAFAAMVYNSMVIATNHSDALIVPPNDRRFAVLTNGGAGDQAFWAATHAWMDDDTNIAAFGRWLQTVDLSGFSPHTAPPQTEAKLAMIDAGQSDLDHAFGEARATLVSPLFTVDQLLVRMQTVLAETDYQLPAGWREIARKMVRREAHRVGVKDSTNWQVRDGNRKYAVYSFDRDVARLWKTRAGLSVEVARNGALGGGSLGGVVVALARP